MGALKMIDIRAASILDFLPESLAAEADIVALSLALDPELRSVAAAVVEAVIMPNIDAQPDWVLNEIAWSMRLDELQIWDDATLAGKRQLLHGILAIRKKSGTRYAVRRIFDLLSVTAELIEWWQEAASPNTYRIRIVVTGDPGITLHQLQQIPELLERFGRASQQLTELAVEANSSGPLYLIPALTVGRQTTIPFGGP